MKNLEVITSECLRNMKASVDFSDCDTIQSINEFLIEIIKQPRMLVNCVEEEKVSIILSTIMTSPFPYKHPTIEGINVKNLVFATAYYLFMHQLETGCFYDKNWPAFILLIHIGRMEFAKFNINMNPFAPERASKILGKPIDYSRLINYSKGLELNMLLVAKEKGFLTDDIKPWFDELYDDLDELLASDPFRTVAIPLYQCIGNNLKENDLRFISQID